MRIDLIAGARPNFMKIAPLIDEINNVKKQGYTISFRLIHTGQHYDRNMSEEFFSQLGLPKPDYNFNAGGGTQAEQTSAIMIAYEKLLFQEKADLCLVVGDVTSTMACAIVAQKFGVKVAHVEAGIRSGDWSMPEEINRMVTDSITNFFFTTTEIADNNLKKLGVSDCNIYRVGNTMIDTLLKYKEKFIKPRIWTSANLEDKKYFVLTLHRPSNVDEIDKVKKILLEILKASRDLPLIFPIHPRTAKVIDPILNELSINNGTEKLHIIEPLGYLEFNYLVAHSLAVITDSGGITEETTVLGIPCMTLRNSTERPETIILGTNELLGTDPHSIKPSFEKLFSGQWKKGSIPDLWDGHTAERIIYLLLRIFN
jgi:UDP-N-acetylglucosamine 2-epimerase (non-hydrolysing)